MMRETKVGLLAGMALILLIGILVSDHLSVSPGTSTNQMTDFADEAQQGLSDPIYVEQNQDAQDQLTPIDQQLPVRQEPIPLADELPLVDQNPRATAPRPAMAVTPATPAPPAAVQVFPAAQASGQPQDIWTESFNKTPFLPAHRVDYQRKTYHTVKDGEYLAHIAKEYLGDAKLWTLIRDANPKKIGANGTVRAGVRLLIPQEEREHSYDENQPGAPAGPRRITVQPGDTLSALAAKHLGSSRQWQQLLDANSDQLKQPQELRPGMKLRLPAAASKDRSAAVKIDQSSKGMATGQRRHNANDPQHYIVKHGDTLSSIAKQHMGSAKRWYDLYRANQRNIEDPDILETGTELVLP